MRIVIDALGTDNRPTPDVDGAVMAAREYGDTIILVGDQARISQELARHNTHGLKVEIVDATEEIAMNEVPSIVMKQKPQSSIHVGTGLVGSGSADAFVSMGNTGAIHAISTLKTLKRIEGVKRPALAAIYPLSGQNVIFLDVGANVDSKPEWLSQFAIMGHVYARQNLGYPSPRVALLSNGEEEGKGNQIIHEAHDLLKTLDINYIGNIEPKDVTTNKADVVVSDGFVGNVFIKTFEASTTYFATVLRREISQGIMNKIGAAILYRAFKNVRKRIDTLEVVGGAPLLGVNGVVIIGHGRSNAIAVRNAVNQARKAVEGNTIEIIRNSLN